MDNVFPFFPSPPHHQHTPHPMLPNQHLPPSPNTSPKHSRKLLFDSLLSTTTTTTQTTTTNNNNHPPKKILSTPDHLTTAQLLRCFDLLHACCQATNPDTTVFSTRRSIEGFLNAVFKDWSVVEGEHHDHDTGAEGGEDEPVLDIGVSVEVIAGCLCINPTIHDTKCACSPSTTIFSPKILARATYHNNNNIQDSTLKLEFRLLQETQQLKEPGRPFSPIGRRDVRWFSSTTDGNPWQKALKEHFRKALLGKMHKYNKRLALWEARRMIRTWIGVGLDGKTSTVRFLDMEDMGLLMMGWDP